MCKSFKEDGIQACAKRVILIFPADNNVLLCVRITWSYLLFQIDSEQFGHVLEAIKPMSIWKCFHNVFPGINCFNLARTGCNFRILQGVSLWVANYQLSAIETIIHNLQTWIPTRNLKLKQKLHETTWLDTTHIKMKETLRTQLWNQEPKLWYQIWCKPR